MLIILVIIWIGLVFVPVMLSGVYNKHWGWIIWLALSVVWIIPIFTGIPLKNNQGQYVGYVTAVEQNGTIFKGWNVYLKTQLESSDAEKACINRDNQKLIADLKKYQENKETVTLEYEGVWQYPIGECPGGNWMIIGIKNK